MEQRATYTHPQNRETPSKNRVWNFSSDSSLCTWVNRPQLPETTSVTSACRYETVSGISYWLSRDPIEERGGVNLYGIGGNNLINNWDYLGLKEVSFLYALGASQGTAGIISAPVTMHRKVKNYKAPKDAKYNCTLSIKRGVSTSTFKDALSKYDRIYFAGHGDKEMVKVKRPNSTLPKLALRTEIIFSDGSFFLNDVLAKGAGTVKATDVHFLVCYDLYVDTDNKLGVKVHRYMQNSLKNNIACNEYYTSSIIKKYKDEKCKCLKIKK